MCIAKPPLKQHTWEVTYKLMARAKPEVESRIAKAAHIFGRLKPLWKDSACSKKWKLRVFEAVVLAVLFYGLDSIVLTKALRDRIDYFHTKCIRHILKIQAAYYSKVSNKKVLDEASILLHGIEPLPCLVTSSALMIVTK